MRTLSRLVPPSTPRTPEIGWVLRRAFGPDDAPVPVVDGPLAATLARRFDLASRIAERTDPGVLAREVGDAAANDLRSAMRGAAGRELLLRETAADLARRALRLGAPIVFLKGFALTSLGVARPGSRFLGDLDALVDDGPRGALVDELLREGWTTKGGTAADHQEAPLFSPAGAMVELHRYVPGVRRSGSDQDLRAAEVAASALGEPHPNLEGAFLPAPAPLLAHALVHGLVQHGAAPESYPLFRFLADVADLRRAHPNLDGASLAAAGLGLEGLDGDDLGAVFGLVEDLVAGREPAAAGPRRLLDHVVAGTLLPDYVLALKSDLVGFAALGDRSARRTAAARAIRTAFFLEDEDIDAIYGRPKSRLGYFGRRLARPFDLALRFARSRLAARRLRRAPTPPVFPGST